LFYYSKLGLAVVASTAQAASNTPDLSTSTPHAEQTIKAGTSKVDGKKRAVDDDEEATALDDEPVAAAGKA